MIDNPAISPLAVPLLSSRTEFLTDACRSCFADCHIFWVFMIRFCHHHNIQISGSNFSLDGENISYMFKLSLILMLHSTVVHSKSGHYKLLYDKTSFEGRVICSKDALICAIITRRTSGVCLISPIAIHVDHLLEFCL